MKHLYMFVINMGVAVLHKYGVGETLQCKVMAVYSRHSHRQRDILSWSCTMMTLSLHPSWTHPHSDKHAFWPTLNAAFIPQSSVPQSPVPQSSAQPQTSFIFSILTLASTPFRNTHGQFIPHSVLQLPPRSSSPSTLSTESSLCPTPFLPSTQPQCTLDSIPPTSLAQPPSALFQLPIQLSTPDDDEDMPAKEFFCKNGHAGENPQDFIKRFKSKYLKDTMTEENKRAAFYNRLKSRNTAEDLYNALPAELLLSEKVAIRLLLFYCLSFSHEWSNGTG